MDLVNSTKSAASIPIVPGHELLYRIGRGAYGEVWLARNDFQKLRAVKIVRRDAFEDPRPFERELQGLQRVEPISRSHDGLVDILQVGRSSDDSWFFYVMELADPAATNSPADGAASGIESFVTAPEDCTLPRYVPRTLRSELRARGHLPVREVLDLCIPIMDALEFLHERELVHRDVKPSNIVFVGGHPKLADIGLVTTFDEARSLVRTEGYSPLEGAGTASADLYSLGVTAYELATGKSTHDVSELPTDLKERPDRTDYLELQEIIFRACAMDPALRYPSAAAMRRDVLRLIGGDSLRQLRISEEATRAVEMRAKRFLRVAMSMGIVTLVALLVAAAIVTIQQRRLELIQERVRNAQALADAERFRSALQEIRLARSEVRIEGWRDHDWSLVKEAARLRPNNEAREAAMGTFIGMDVQLVRRFANFSVGAMTFDATGDRLAMAGLTNGVRIWNRVSGDFETCIRIGTGPVGFDESGNPVQMTCAGPGEFELWDLIRREVSHRFKINDSRQPGEWPDWVGTPMALSFDARRLAGTACFPEEQGRCLVWDVRTGRTLVTDERKVFALAFSPDGSLFAAGDNNGTIFVWSVLDGKRLADLPGKGLSLRSLVFHRDPHKDSMGRSGWLLAAGDEGGIVQVWDVTGRQIRNRIVASPFHVYALAFNADGTLLASTGRGLIRLWDLASSKCLISMGVQNAYTCLAFSPDDRHLAAASRDAFGVTGQVELYAIDSGMSVRLFRGLDNYLTAVAMSPDGRRIAALGSDWRVAVWDAQDGRLLNLWNGPRGEIGVDGRIAFNSDGRFLVAGPQTGIPGRATAWNCETGQQLGNWEFEDTSALVFDDEGRLIRFALQSKGRHLASADGEYLLSRSVPFEGGGSRAIGSLTLPPLSRIRLLAIQGGRRVIVDGDTDLKGIASQDVWMLDGETGREVWRLPVALRRTGQGTVKVDAAEKWLLAIDDYVLSVETGQSIGRTSTPFAALSPSRDWMAWFHGGHDLEGAWRLRRTGNGDIIPAFSNAPRDGRVCMPMFSRDGRSVAIGRADGIVMLCNVEEISRRLGEIGLGWPVK